MVFTKSAMKRLIFTGIVFLGLDLVWLTQISPPIYKKYIGHLLADEPNLLAAVAFYIIYLAGINHFVIKPSLASASQREALCNGALLGFFAYATFDLTSQAVFRDWPTIITIIDLVWGSFVTGLTSWIVVSVYLKKDLAK